MTQEQFKIEIDLAINDYLSGDLTEQGFKDSICSTMIELARTVTYKEEIVERTEIRVGLLRNAPVFQVTSKIKIRRAN